MKINSKKKIICEACKSSVFVRLRKERKQRFCSVKCSIEFHKKFFTEQERVLSNRKSRKRYYLKHKNKWNEYANQAYKKKKEQLGLKPNTSKEEANFYEKLLKNYSADEIIRNTRSIIRNPKTCYPLELDFYIPKERLAYEINGICHRQPIRGGIKKFLARKRNDKIKQNECKKLGIELKLISV